ncbi:MAG: hypothetical protein AAGF72_17330 [Pseudomonadota bacterium]
MHGLDTKVDYRLLSALSDLVLCSRFFRRGQATPVPQLISARHSIKNLCSSCVSDSLPERGKNSPQRQRLLAKYLSRD